MKYIDVNNIKFTGDVYYDGEGERLVRLKDVKKAIAQTPAEQLEKVVYCKECVLHNRCKLEIIFKLSNVYNSFCCAGKKSNI